MSINFGFVAMLVAAQVSWYTSATSALAQSSLIDELARAPVLGQAPGVGAGVSPRERNAFERNLRTSLTLPNISSLQFEDCTIDIVIKSPHACTQAEQYKSIVLRVDLREVEYVQLGGTSDRQLLEFSFSQFVRSALSGAKNSLMDRTLDQERGDFDGTPLKRYSIAEDIMSDNGIRSGRRFVQCNGLKGLSISSSLNEYIPVDNDYQEGILQMLRAELKLCKAGI